MSLLDPKSDLKLVRLEGMNPADVPDDDDSLLGCDLSEYFGSDRLTDSKRVVLSQLKYSVRHASRPWTDARLCAVKKTGGASVVSRLAEMFTRLGGELSAEERDSKVAIALVSNQPVGAELSTTLESARTALSGRRLGVYSARAFSALPAKQRKSLENLRKASGLSSGQFTDFIRLLDVSGCGAGSRALQRLTLGSELSSVTLDGPEALPAAVEMMRSCMMPETANDAGIHAADMLVALGSSGPQSLFPFPPRFVVPRTRVPSSQAQQLAETVAAVAGQRVLAHGQPGVGKSTTLTSIEAHLPTGSVVVAYDCYAAGDYLNPAEARHSVRALVQIINETALRTGTLPLVVRDGLVEESVLWRQFQDRLAVAAASLVSGALLVIAIDAADNSVTAADRSGDRSFIHRLWRVRLPENVRLVMTSRSGRRGDVLHDVGDVDIEPVDVPAFDLAASTAMLRIGFPTASAEQGAEFHQRSRGFARVQAYALGHTELPRPADSERIGLGDAIERAGRELPDLFDEVLNTALASIQDPATRRAQVAALAAMARPTRISTLASVLDVDDARVESLMRDLMPGLTVDEAGVGFSDEDFEQHVRAAIGGDDLLRAHNRFADHFHARRWQDGNAAQRLGEHLFIAGRAGDLVTLVLDEGMPTAIDDGLLRAQTFRARIGFALRLLALESGAEATPGDAAAAHVVQLVLAAADAARTDSSHIETVKAAPELAVLHSEPSAVAAILTRTDSDGWRGKLHTRAAALLAGSGRQAEATEQLSLAEAWLRAWARDPDRDSHVFDAADVAHAALATFVVRGPEAGLQFLSGWRPREFVEQVTGEFLRLAPGVIPVREIVKASTVSRSSSVLQAHAAVAYAKAGETVSAAWVRRISAALDRLPLRRLREPPAWGVEFCELALASGASKARTCRLLERLGTDAPHHLSDFDVHARVRGYLQAACLKAACSGTQVDLSVLADALPSVEDRPDYGKNQRSLFKSAGNLLLPAMQARAQCLSLANASTDPVTAIEALDSAIREGMRGLGQRARWRESGRGDGNIVWFAIAAGAIGIGLRVTQHLRQNTAQETSSNATFGDSTTGTPLYSLLVDLADSARMLGSDAGARIWLRMAKEVIAFSPERGLDLLGEAADGFESTTMPANELRDLLVDAAGVAHRYDPDFAAELFERAVRAAEGIDADIDRRLRTLAYVAAGAAGATEPSEAAELARKLTEALEDATPFVYEPGDRLSHSYILEVAAHLHGPTGFAACFRWAHERRIELEYALAAVLPPLVAKRTMEPGDAFWLLRLLGTSGRIVETADPIVTATTAGGPTGKGLAARQLATLAEWVARDCTAEQRRAAAEALCALADRLGFAGLDCIARTRLLATALEDLEPSEDPATGRNSRNWGGGPRNGEQKPLTGQMASIEEDLAVLGSVYSSYTVVIDHLTNTAQSAPRGARIATLDQLTELAERKVPRADAHCIAAVLKELLPRWRTSPAVRAWAETRLPAFVVDHLPDLFTAGSDPDGAYATVVALPADAQSLATALIQATAVHLDSLTATQLHAIIRPLSDAMLNAQARVLVVTAALASPPTDSHSPVAQRLADAHATRRALPQPPDGSMPLLAVALWSLLGHEDRRYRWLATHTIRLLLTRGPGQPLLSEFWNLASQVRSPRTAEATSYASFRAADLEFFDMSAMQWLLLAVARVAHENAAVIAPIINSLVDCALDSVFPHAVIRELARRAALAAGSTLPEGVIEELRFTSTPLSCSIPKTRGRSSRDQVDSRFTFDQMDTIPYWIGPLAETFYGVTNADVADRADTWITDHWGRTETTGLDPLLERDESLWNLTGHGHGSIPTLEISNRYLEYHGLQCAAGELADSGIPLEVDGRGAYDTDVPWQDWLATYMPQDDGLWLSDLRTPTPVRPITTGSWAKLGPGAAEPPASNRDRDVDARPAVLELLREVRTLDDDPEMIVVNASVHTNKHRWTCMASVSSALVNSVGGPSLLHALADDRRQPNNLPFADAGISSWDEIDVPGLRLRGWLIESIYPHDGMDRHDPLACGLSRRLTRPSPEFLTALGLEQDQSGTRFIGADGALGGHLRCWAEEDSFRWRGRDPHESSGDYLAIRRNVLANLLAERRMSLVTSVHASFSSSPYRTGGQAQERSHSATRYLLFHHDGSEEELNVETG